MKTDNTSHYTLLRSHGRNMGLGLLEKAIKTANDAHEMSNNILVCRRAAITILAHELLNQEKEFGITREDYLKELKEHLVTEYRQIKSDGTVDVGNVSLETPTPEPVPVLKLAPDKIKVTKVRV